MEPNQQTSQPMPQPLPTPIEPPSTPPPTAGTNKTMIYMVIFAVVVFAGLLLFFLMQQKKTINQLTNNNNSTVNQAVLPTAKLTKGSLNLVPKSGLAKYTLAENIVLNLVADSNAEDISGYDALISYDNTAFDFVSSKSSIADFKIFSFPKESYVSVTATKSLQSTTPSVFSNTVLMEIIFKPKKAGNYTIAISKEKGRETTKFVNTATKLIYPLLNNVSVEVN